MSFSDFQQQKEIAAQLHHSLERERLAHAYLLPDRAEAARKPWRGRWRRR